jgi:hypothetical protein
MAGVMGWILKLLQERGIGRQREGLCSARTFRLERHGPRLRSLTSHPCVCRPNILLHTVHLE